MSTQVNAPGSRESLLVRLQVIAGTAASLRELMALAHEEVGDIADSGGLSAIIAAVDAMALQIGATADQATIDMGSPGYVGPASRWVCGEVYPPTTGQGQSQPVAG